MSIEERVRQHLDATTVGFRAPDHLDEVRREGRRRQARNRMLTVVGAAAAVAAVVTVGPRILPDPPEAPTLVTSPGPATTEADQTPDPVTQPEEALGVVTADESGIRLLDTSGREINALTSDDYYEAISVAYPDQRGGLVFQHTVTPQPWPQGSLMRLAPGAERPEILAASRENRAPVPVGPATSADGSALFVYLAETNENSQSVTGIFAADLDQGGSALVQQLDSDTEVSVGGGVIALVDREDFQCPRLEMISVEGEPLEAELPDCLPSAAGIAVGHNGNRLAVLDGSHLEILDLSSGATMSEWTIPDAYMVVSGPGGWVVRTPTETRLIDGSGEQSLPPVEQGWVGPFGHRFEIPEAGASLGSGSGELPCQPTSANPSGQDLPEPVAATRAALLELAATCDYAGLAELARSDETNISFGDPADPARFWVAEGRSGEEPLATLVDLLTGEGVEGDGLWTWPAEFTDGNTDVSGYRVGIASDGRWQFFVAGD